MAGNGRPWTSSGGIEQRRRLVSTMLIRRPNITRRELHAEIAKRMQNPKTDEPFSLSTIQNDVTVLREGWKQRTNQNVDEWIAEEIATVDELQGDAWSEREYQVVLRCVQERAKLKGLYSPERREITGADGRELIPTDVLVAALKAADEALNDDDDN